MRRRRSSGGVRVIRVPHSPVDLCLPLKWALPSLASEPGLVPAASTSRVPEGAGTATPSQARLTSAGTWPQALVRQVLQVSLRRLGANLGGTWLARERRCPLVWVPLHGGGPFHRRETRCGPTQSAEDALATPASSVLRGAHMWVLGKWCRVWSCGLGSSACLDALSGLTSYPRGNLPMRECALGRINPALVPSFVELGAESGSDTWQPGP